MPVHTHFAGILLRRDRNLTSVKIGNGVSYVGSFNNCPNITDIWYGSSVNSISAPSIKTFRTITSANLTPPSVAYFPKENYDNARLIVPQEALEKYRTTSPWLNFKYISGSDLNGIDDVCVRESSLKFEVIGNCIIIVNDSTATICDLKGLIIQRVEAGTHELKLGAGLYIISCGEVNEKILIR